MRDSDTEILLAVRHPIERLLSAYRDRVFGLKVSYSFYARLAKTLKLTRTDTKLPGKKKVAGKVVSRKIAVPTWPEFVAYILKTSTQKDVGPHFTLPSYLVDSW